MPSEVAKKRGRPKKVISDPIDLELPETKKSTTRLKSTKAAPKAVKTAPTTAKKTPVPSAASDPATGTAPIVKTASSSFPATTPSSPKAEPKAPAPPKRTSVSPLTPETSKILEKVREISSKGAPVPADPKKSSKPLPVTTSAEADMLVSKTPTPPEAPSPSTTTPPVAKMANTAPKPSQILSAASEPPPRIPLAALNSEIVSNISSRAGARPNTSGSGKLPPNYRPVARKVTMAIVAMPILIVTSYVLYERLVLGEGRKLLVKPGLAMVEAPEEGRKEQS